MPKAPTATEKYKKKHDNKKSHKNCDYTTIADRLMMVSLGRDSNQTGVVKPLYGTQPPHSP